MLDLLIIGQGLAGSLLAWTAQKHGLSVLVVDCFRKNSSSRVAGGVFNPITGRRFVKTWMADDLFPFAEDVYRDIELELNRKFYYQKPIYRTFTSVDQRFEFLNKIEDDDPAPFTPYLFETGILPKEIIHPFGGLVIPGGGWLNTDRFLSSIHDKLIAKQELFVSDFHHDQVKVKSGTVRWKGFEAKKLILAEGWYNQPNPWFPDLPFVPTKGEVLTLEVPGLKLDGIVSRNGFILPLENGYFRVGATYNWDELSFDPTEAGREELLLKVKSMISCPFEIIEHEVGVRPTVNDRRPFIGWSKAHQEIGIFNGFGTKGVSLIPWFANHFIEHIIEGKKLLDEVDVARVGGK
ncbi:FAD-dependent oxidoreductase [Accumulibacter sp.]|uniref:NAD(P)/FAD-dependent oxidoreductase n=1 Tax=Accumulibacter sp. TaxID=2053492 RepID=UPI001ACD95FB|nr:FAD-dependent oxidoreductase [Accumulibacter sp.]MBN8498168.1 FAD-dependent oxidoreductase [Accumulibacter sp.]MBN8707348.1 FAD-dependent oxidoreductase [Bacteroidota bacterium]